MPSFHGSQRLQSQFTIHCAITRALTCVGLCCALLPGVAWAQAGTEQVATPSDSTKALVAQEHAASTSGQSSPTKTVGAAEETVTVTGQRPTVVYGQRDPTVASSVVLREQLERPGATAVDALATLPGVSVLRVGTPAEFASASVRGADSRQIPVYLANIPLNDDVSGSADLSMLPLWMVQRIEVYRGASPQDGVRAGLAGAIYFEPLHPTKPGVGALVSAGSFGERGVAVRAAVGSERASSLLALRYGQARNDYPFVNDHGQRFDLIETVERRQNADFSDVEAWSVNEWSTPGGVRITALVQGMRREQGATSAALSPARYARAERRRLLAGVTANAPCATDGTCELTLTLSGLRASTTLLDPFSELRVSGGDWAHQKGERLLQSAQLKLKPLSQLELRGLLFHADERLELRHEVARPRDATIEELGFSAQALAFSDRRLSPAILVSARCAWTAGEFVYLSRLQQRDETMCALAPPDVRGGLRFQLTDSIKLLANAGRFTQIPSLGQLYGVNAAVTGNPGLQSEVSDNLDVGMRASVGGQAVRVDWEAFGFARWATRLIQYQRTSLNTVAPFNLGRARFVGAEAAISAVAFGWLQSRTALTLLDPRRLGVPADENSILPLQARSQLSQTLTVTRGFRLLTPISAAASVHYRHQASRYLDPTGLVVLPGQHRADADVRLELPTIGLRVMVAINNLTDNRMLDLLGLPLPGRSFHGSLEGNLN